jgi:hypothetical protein
MSGGNRAKKLERKGETKSAHVAVGPAGPLRPPLGSRRFAEVIVRSLRVLRWQLPFGGSPLVGNNERASWYGRRRDVAVQLLWRLKNLRAPSFCKLDVQKQPRILVIHGLSSRRSNDLCLRGSDGPRHFSVRLQVVPDYLAARRSSSLCIGSSLRKASSRRPARFVRSFNSTTNEPAHSGTIAWHSKSVVLSNSLKRRATSRAL